jgi:hypothetical protein
MIAGRRHVAGLNERAGPSARESRLPPPVHACAERIQADTTPALRFFLAPWRPGGLSPLLVRVPSEHGGLVGQGRRSIAALLGPTARQGTQPLSLSSAAAYTLIEHSWPNNVRELEQRLKIGTLLGSSGRIDLAIGSPEAAVEGAVDRPERRTPVTLQEIEHALKEMLNVSAAAKMLQIHRSHLYRLIRQFGIDTHGE